MQIEKEDTESKVFRSKEPNTFHTTAIGLGKDSYTTKRSVYTYFDLLGDMGGLQSTLLLFGQVFMFLFGLVTPDPLTIKLISSLFFTE